MRWNAVRLPLLLVGALATAGCNARPDADSPPAAGQPPAVAHAPATAPAGAARPSSEPGPGAADERGPDRPGAPKTAPASGDPVATAPRRADDAPAANAVRPPDRAVPKAAEPTADQIARWRLPEFRPLVLLACRDGFEEAALLDLAISPRGRRFAVAGSKLTLWEAGDDRPAADLLATLDGEAFDRPLAAVAISDDGRWVAAGDRKGRVRIWSLDDRSEVLQLQAHPGRITHLAFAPDSQLLATTSYSGDVAIWHLPDGKPVTSLKASQREVSRLAFLGDGVLATASDAVCLWDVASGQKTATLTKPEVRSPGFALSQDRRVLAFDESSASVRLWDVPGARPTDVTLPGAGATLAAFSRDGKWLAADSGDHTIGIWETATGSLVQRILADGDRTTALAWFPDADVLLVGSLAGRVRLWGRPDAAGQLGVEPMRRPELPAIVAGAHRPLSSGQFQQIVDVRSLPRLPGALPLFSGPGMSGYTALASPDEAKLFYRYVLGRAGWSESPEAAGPGLLAFRKDGCELNVSVSAADAGGGNADGAGKVQVSLNFPGNFDARWLPQAAAIESKSSWGSFSSVSYRTKASMVDTEVALLSQLHAAGWTGYSRLDAASREEPEARHLSFLQGGSLLTVFISRPADAPGELAVQTSLGVSDRSLPVPPDAGWMEYDESSTVKMVANTRMDLAQAAKFYDESMAAEGWSARDAGRAIEDDRGFLPYIRGQQDVLIRLVARPGGGTRVIVGDVANASWQLQAQADAKPQARESGPGIEAADLALPAGATAVKYAVDERQIQFELADTTPPKLSEQIAAQMKTLGWERQGAGVASDEYVLMSFAKGKAELQLRARAAQKATAASISGDGLLWNKPLPVAPMAISFETWLRRNQKDASLERLDQFAAEMRAIPAPGSRD